MSIDDLDKRIIARLQGDLPLVPEPFADLAQELGLSQDEVVERISRMAESGVMRRFGATLRHQQSGFPANAMVAWRVDPADADRAGEVLASFREVTHCYLRETCGEFPYNLYSMVHGKDEAECRRVVKKMAEAVGIDDYELLFSREELKKTSMQYYGA
ncbi:MAG: AsnC family transcriptional regulator [Desulfarculaceae bacterium]